MDLAVSYEPEVFRARDEGLRVKAVGALVQAPLTSIISLPHAEIRSPADLRGKTVGTAGIDYQSAYLRTILLEAGVDPRTVKERNVGFGLTPALLTKRVDAVLGAFWNYEGTELELRDRNPQIIRMEKAGVPDLRRARAGGQRGRAGARRRANPRLHRGAGARHSGPARRTPTRRSTACSRPTATSTPSSSARWWTSPSPYFLPPGERPYGWQDPGGVERLRRLAAREQAGRERPGRPRRLHQRAAARRGALA